MTFCFPSDSRLYTGHAPCISHMACMCTHVTTVHIWTQSSTENTFSSFTFRTHCDFDIRSRSHKMKMASSVRVQWYIYLIKTKTFQRCCSCNHRERRENDFVVGVFYFYFDFILMFVFGTVLLYMASQTDIQTIARSPLHRLTCVFRMSRERVSTRKRTNMVCDSGNNPAQKVAKQS